MAAPKSRNTRMPAVPGGASKWLRYVHTCSQAAGSQFCQDSGATVCGRVTVTNALSSKPGRLLSADAGPNSQPALNGTVVPAGPRAVVPAGPTAVLVGAPASGVVGVVGCAAARAATSHAVSPAVPPSAAYKNQRRLTVMGWRASRFQSPIGRSSTQRYPPQLRVHAGTSAVPATSKYPEAHSHESEGAVLLTGRRRRVPRPVARLPDQRDEALVLRGVGAVAVADRGPQRVLLDVNAPEQGREGKEQHASQVGPVR